MNWKVTVKLKRQEEQEKNEQPSQYITEKNPTKQTGEKDAKKNRN